MASNTNKIRGFKSQSFPDNVITKGGVLKTESEKLLNRFLKKSKYNNLKLN